MPCCFSRADTNTPLQFDSDDEREAVQAKSDREHKLVSQNTKKAMKNRALLPRTAGLRSITELSSSMTKAGLDPSRITERAEMLAKVAGAKRKREREEDEAMAAAMEEDESGEEGEGDWMDVDGQEAPKIKRKKANSGAVVAKHPRAPKTNRQLSGMRDEAVSCDAVSAAWTGTDRPFVLSSNHQKRSSCGISGRENATTRRRPERAIVRSRPKWCVFISSCGVLKGDDC